MYNTFVRWNDSEKKFYRSNVSFSYVTSEKPFMMQHFALKKFVLLLNDKDKCSIEAHPLYIPLSAVLSTALWTRALIILMNELFLFIRVEISANLKSVEIDLFLAFWNIHLCYLLKCCNMAIEISRFELSMTA